MKTVLLMLNGATLDGQPHLLEFLIGNLKWLTTNNPFQCISFDHVRGVLGLMGIFDFCSVPTPYI